MSLRKNRFSQPKIFLRGTILSVLGKLGNFYGTGRFDGTVGQDVGELVGIVEDEVGIGYAIIKFMTSEDLIRHWKDSASDSLDTSNTLFIPGKYHHCLFFLHLAIEKILKAVFVKRKNNTPPPTHDLVRLAEAAGFPTEENRKLELAEISSFNVSARYDDYKKQFYAKATKEYAGNWLDKGKTIFTELEAMLS